MNSRSNILAAAGLALALTACADQGDLVTPAYMGGPDNFGEANRQTMAAQIIDPAPRYLDPVPVSSAEHAAQAVQRYREDKVKIPDRVRTTDAGVQEESREASN
ncbi:hypothetical protein [Tsuneonella sp. HG222]